nr:amidase family protein [Streptomyces sp. NBC_00886]
MSLGHCRVGVVRRLGRHTEFVHDREADAVGDQAVQGQSVVGGGGDPGCQPGVAARGVRRGTDQYDVLVMPTLSYTAKEIPPADVSLADYLHTALSMVGNPAPFDVTGHPSCGVPTDLVDGLPAGLMITGRRFDDVTVLRVAHTCERAVGGFPTP